MSQRRGISARIYIKGSSKKQCHIDVGSLQEYTLRGYLKKTMSQRCGISARINIKGLSKNNNVTEMWDLCKNKH